MDVLLEVTPHHTFHVRTNLKKSKFKFNRAEEYTLRITSVNTRVDQSIAINIM